MKEIIKPKITASSSLLLLKINLLMLDTNKYNVADMNKRKPIKPNF